MKKRIFFLLSALALAAIALASPPGGNVVTGKGTANGFGGPNAITVTVTLKDGVIADVKAEGPKETQGIGSVALEKMPASMLAGNTIKVDGVSGATVSSTGILQAAEAALVAAGVDPKDYQAAAVARKAEDTTYEADVAIIGAGGAGMVAAIVAADAGKTVVIVEKQAMVGGNSVRATGGMNAAHTPEQAKNSFSEKAGIEKTLKTASEKWAGNAAITALADTVREQWAEWQKKPEGYFDSPELMELDTLIGGHGINNPDLVRTLCENTAGAVEWLKTIGIDLTSAGFAGGASVKRIHRPLNEEKKVVSVGAYMIPRLEAACKARSNITLLMETAATSLLTDESGAVTGVAATGKDNNKITIHSKAVVMASGGFGANLEMVAKLKPELKGFMTTNAPGATGEGIVMGQEIGADVVDMDQIQIHPTVQFDSSSLITEGLRGDGAILVNKEGKRFIDEVLTRDVVSAAEIAQPDSFAWLIIDQKMVDESSVIKGYIAKGYTFKGDTYADLAKTIAIPADVFDQTMKSWNVYAEKREDPDFGRTSFTDPLIKAPFYAIKVTPGIHHTMGGLRIDTRARVLKKDGSAIPGLFAAGEVTGGVHGGNRLGGTAVADFVVFGRIAGQSASEAQDREYAADVAVIGGGGAGMVAAIATADAGKSVVLIEKQGMLGGNSVRATGGMNATHTPEQDKNTFSEKAGVEKTLKVAAEKWADHKAISALAKTVQEQWAEWQKKPEGYFDSVELMQLDTLIGGHGINDPALVETLCANTADSIAWLKTIGIDLTSVGAFGGASVKRIHRPLNDEGKVVSVGAYMIPRLETACRARSNITILTETAADTLLTDKAQVVGVVATGKGGNKITVRSKAVVLAAGGFGANLKMVSRLNPALAGFMTTNAPGATGEGITMGQELGAAVSDMKRIQIHPTVQFDSAALITEGLRGDGAILVNSEGKRFIDETGTRDVVSAAEIAQPGSFSWLVIDQKMADASSVIKGYINRGYTVQGDSFAALAGAMGVNAESFEKTMKDWNSYVEGKNDPDFGRTSFASPLAQAPFYAIKVTAGIHHTMGGLKIDKAARVLRGNGSIIPGLFAAGEITGGVHGGNRLGGNAVADFVVFGRIAGQGAASF
ncbi:MAG: flavocytochrome c [Synergistaceae bacterium]|nr:flavocytochrome c [Synergistaceae bacterium]